MHSEQCLKFRSQNRNQGGHLLWSGYNFTVTHIITELLILHYCLVTDHSKLIRGSVKSSSQSNQPSVATQLSLFLFYCNWTIETPHKQNNHVFVALDSNVKMEKTIILLCLLVHTSTFLAFPTSSLFPLRYLGLLLCIYLEVSDQIYLQNKWLDWHEIWCVHAPTC